MVKKWLEENSSKVDKSLAQVEREAAELILKRDIEYKGMGVEGIGCPAIADFLVTIPPDECPYILEHTISHE